MARMKRTRTRSRSSKKRSRTDFPLSQLQQSQTASIAKRAALRASETKRNVIGINYNMNTNGFQSWDFSDIDQGDDIQHRNGRQILTTSFKKNLFIRNNSFLEPILVRMLVLQAKSGHQDSVLATSPLFNPSLIPNDNNASWSDHTGQGKIQAILKPIDTTNFIVREDKRFILGALPNPDKSTEYDGAASTGRMSYHDGRSSSKFTRSSLNLKGRKMHFDSSGNCDDRLHLVLMCCQVDGSQILGSTMSVVGNGCLYFKDP